MSGSTARLSPVTTMGSRSFNGCGASPQASTSSCLPSTCSNSTARTYGGTIRDTQGDACQLASRMLPGLRINEHLPYPGDVVFRHACKMGLEGIASKRWVRPIAQAVPGIGSSSRTRMRRRLAVRRKKIGVRPWTYWNA